MPYLFHGCVWYHSEVRIFFVVVCDSTLRYAFFYKSEWRHSEVRSFSVGVYDVTLRYVVFLHTDVLSVQKNLHTTFFVGVCDVTLRYVALLAHCGIFFIFLWVFFLSFCGCFFFIFLWVCVTSLWGTQLFCACVWCHSEVRSFFVAVCDVTLRYVSVFWDLCISLLYVFMFRRSKVPFDL